MSRLVGIKCFVCREKSLKWKIGGGGSPQRRGERRDQRREEFGGMKRGGEEVSRKERKERKEKPQGFLGALFFAPFAFFARNSVLLAYVSKCAAGPLVCGGRRAPIGRTRKGPPGEAQRCATQWAFLSAKLRTIRAAGLRGIRYRRLSECTAAGIP